MSLSSLKRKLTPGSVVYLRECLSGWVQPSESRREVFQNTSNAVKFKRDKADGSAGVSWLYWPAAALFTEDADGFTCYEKKDDGSRILAARYSFAAPLPDEPRPVKAGYWFTVSGVDTAAIRNAGRMFAQRVPAGIEQDHALAVIGEQFGWTVDAATVPGIAEALLAVRWNPAA